MALTEQNMEGLISVSEKLREIVNRVGRASTWLLVPLVIITMWDVVARKLVWIQIFMVQNFGSFFRININARNGMAPSHSRFLFGFRLWIYS